MLAKSNDLGSSVIVRTALLLRTLEEHPLGLTIAALSRHTGMPRTTVHRLVSSLEAEEFLLNVAGLIRLGPALTRLAASAHRDVVALARTPMEMLGRRTRETVDLSVMRGTHVLLISQYASDQELRVISPVGTAFPSHCTAPGKALLACLKDEQIVSFYQHTPDIRTQNSLSSVEDIHAEVVRVREVGYAIDREEHAQGVCGLSVHIQSSLSELYAVSVAVPSLRFEEKKDFIIASLMKCKAEIEVMISG
ncbi:IclR family transcriptional regulator [Cronobacter turicensis]|nr:IclR family transcriptional regulator [Cronobacter turicensis]